MSQPDTCSHGRSECKCLTPGARHLRKQALNALPMTTRVAFEHDFVRLEQQARAAHAFFEAGMYDEAMDWLVEIVNVGRGLRAALSPCDHNWTQMPNGELACTKGCSVVQLR